MIEVCIIQHVAIALPQTRVGAITYRFNVGVIHWHPIDNAFVQSDVNFRRLVVRYERRAENFLGFVQLGCMIILLRHL